MIKTLAVLLVVIYSGLAYADCSSPTGTAGRILWFSGDLKVKYCDGSNWKDTSQSTAASCAGIDAGKIKYASGALSYCNGANWVTMSSSNNLGSCSGIAAGKILWDGAATKLKVCNGTSWFDLAASAYAYTVTLAASENNVLLTGKLTALGWNGTSPVSVLLTINSGVIIGSTSTATAALRTGALPAGSTVKIVNNGRIQGKGGNGVGGSAYGGYNGEDGGPALDISLNIELDNSSGNIWGGGGGGFACMSINCGYDIGGGGGAGTQVGSALGVGGMAGSAGSATAGGDGAIDCYGTYGADSSGGNGGGPGLPGAPVSDNACPNGLPGNPGAAGKAISLNGKAVNWLGGNNGTQVRGPMF